ncbi:MAG: SPFH domain-containing protein [Deferribacteres bacterium]|nr:SPFH domain-containing protein [candidate division KSB1 bacterium]MCB9510191.1 SPFH domain-containing protein [Deferribacteres bacterium]
MVLLSVVGLIYSITWLKYGESGPLPLIFSILSLSFFLVLYGGLFTVEPNEAVVLLLFGKYQGTEKTTGFRWANPLYTKRKISLRMRNFDSDKLKVNDKNGNPIEISAVVVWRVDDSAQAVFQVDDFLEYVTVQSESAIRHIATSYPYDTGESDEMSLRASIQEVCHDLKVEIQERVDSAGVVVEEARINHLAYAQEIASAMLQRQQAEAIIAARQKIVEGAVGMVQMALEKLKQDSVLELDEERKANMVSNLMVVLCADKAATPVLNAGSLY